MGSVVGRNNRYCHGVTEREVPKTIGGMAKISSKCIYLRGGSLQEGKMKNNSVLNRKVNPIVKNHYKWVQWDYVRR